jgi:hypothetical protein
MSLDTPGQLHSRWCDLEALGASRATLRRVRTWQSFTRTLGPRPREIVASDLQDSSESFFKQPLTRRKHAFVKLSLATRRKDPEMLELDDEANRALQAII